MHHMHGYVATQGSHALISPVTCRGATIAIDDAAPRREDGTTPGSYSRSAEGAQGYASSHPLDPMDAMSMEAATGDESMGPARRHPDDRIRNGYKPY